ncbi:CaiB/BaiF CoA-transferase family protein [Sporosarcina pasteurii]|uniref:Formyl-coenzyme A transferase n=1 Tax=Sporosarcina pasteurii TaxID=1474 RepID=A0A380BEZ7_SPOPA|nr:CaiB/BaiF CoA-transferase family protein [Sporosarcina pasteurii]MDS9472555.1 CaiB/BaiF CoA-transferase family protein [Sporosarcina pasteurii]QBQ06108.1 CoA transferase [Sporosarcina pasteurii]SUI99416.1 Formyl-coenzyme A transferase [Sporosarcina pasteurii]
MKRPLEGIKVLELGNIVAAPFAGKILAEFGAEVIKVEEPTSGDPLRQWRVMHNGTSVWWSVQSRNKKSVTANLREPHGQEIVKKLVSKVDVVLENFKPGTLEKWKLGYEELKKINPSIILTRISGYGQTGPYKEKPGFGSVAEAIGGLRYLTGYPDLPPVRMGIAIGDMVAGLYAVIGTLMALRVRDEHPEKKGQVIDVALYEAVFSLLEGVLPEYDLSGQIRERTGSTLPGVAPSNTYECADGKHVVIGGNGDQIFQRLMRAINREDLADEPKYADNQGRADDVNIIDAAIEAWTKKHTLAEVQQVLDQASVPVGPIYNIQDIVKDPHYKARGMLQEVVLPDGKKILVPGIVPKLSETPGKIESNGPTLGEHNEELYSEYLDFTFEDFRKLKEKGVV